MAPMDDHGTRDMDETPPKPVIVGIGASAGGIRALQAFFESVPTDTGAAFVVIVHLDPKVRSELPSVLSTRTSMPVSQVIDPEELRPDHVYVIPPDRRLRLTENEISTAEFDEPRGRRAPVDLFFRSLAEQHGDGFAVIMSGAGADGAIGVKDVKEAGGIIMVQDPAEAEYPSMPRSAIATGVADLVLPVRELASRLHRLIRMKQNRPDGDHEVDEEMLRRLLAHVRVRTGHDFSKYKRSTVLRRITRRMQVTRTDDLSDYYDFLRDNAEEAQALLADLLISVTTFFRDPDTFEGLKSQVVPHLFDIKTVSDTVRIWVPGCATGEEAYSIAMIALEEAARHDIRPAIQVFGSDLDSRALALAREGLYPAAIEADVSEERLRRFFVHEGDHYRVRRELRDIVLFASHSVLKDPPFSRIDLISCRNLLIYLDRDLQQQVCSTFHYALNPGGYLVVGSSETADNPPGLFLTLDRKARIYQSSASSTDKPRLLPRLLGGLGAHEHYSTPGGRPLAPSVALNEAAIHREAIEKVAPPSMLVDTSHRVVHLSEHAGRFFQPSGGPMSGDVVDLVRPEFRFELRSALHRAFELGQSTLSLPILVRFNGSPHRVHFQVKPAFEDSDARPRHALVLFIEGEAVEADSTLPDQRSATDETVRRLSEELQLTQARLRTTREESEAANEELRAANEELQSINEEYRSTSEELETSKEELQSINEELQTVNSELKLKLEAVSRGHSDLQNLMAATDFGTLFLDASLRIKRFTKPVTDIFRITPSDEGRPVTDFAHQLLYDDLVKDAETVLTHLSPIRREVRSRDNRWYDVRLRPYRTVDDKIDGVVITFVDVSDRRAWEERQQLLLGELSHRIKNTLAVVQAIAHQTQRYSTSPEDFIARFDGRLRALSSAHALLVASDWRGADLAALAREQLAAYTMDNPDRVRLEGEPVTLRADLATPFGLVMHELATNAAKHGALSRPGGTIHLRWTVEPRNHQPTLIVSWTERGGPAVQAPKSSGFGGTLIQNSIPQAKVRRDFRSDGLVCTMEIPLSEATEGGATAQA